MPRRFEPSIDEMLDDPVVRALMVADRVDPDDLRALLRSIAHCRSRRTSEPDPTPPAALL